MNAETTSLRQNAQVQVGNQLQLLEPYVWKTPTSDLEALRHILRAIPVAVGPVVWRPEAKRSAEQLAEEAAKLARDAEDNRRELERLSALLKPREITPEQASKILETLKDITKGPMAIGPWITAGDEPKAHARQFRKLFEEAGFTLDPIDKTPSPALNGPEGVHLYVENAKAPPPHAAPIVSILSSLGLACSRLGQMPGNKAPDKVFLIVNRKSSLGKTDCEAH